jgi:hypothetical protein
MALCIYQVKSDGYMLNAAPVGPKLTRSSVQNNPKSLENSAFAWYSLSIGIHKNPYKSGKMLVLFVGS